MSAVAPDPDSTMSVANISGAPDHGSLIAAHLICSTVARCNKKFWMPTQNNPETYCKEDILWTLFAQSTLQTNAHNNSIKAEDINFLSSIIPSSSIHLNQPTNVYLVPNRTWTYLQVSSTPPPSATPTGKHILIIGGSVTALTNAWLLLDMGYRVTVISDRYAPAEPRVTGQIAGALWEYPPAVCGQHTDEVSIDKSKIWCQISRDVFTDLVEKHGELHHGIQIQIANFFFTHDLHDASMKGQAQKMDEIQKLGLPGFLHNPKLIERHRVNQNAGVADAYRHEAPVIDTDAYLVWLNELVQLKGAEVKRIDPIKTDLLKLEHELLEKYQADVILNATGLGSRELAQDDSVYPIRGCLIRVKNDGKRFPIIKEVLAVSNTDTEKMDNIVFIVPRNDQILLLGGSVEPHEENLDLTMESQLVKNMRARCNNFVTGLENAELDEVPLVQGLRPFRQKSIRVDNERRLHEDGSSSKIVHCYGHGGSGFTLSFGSAMQAVALIEDVCTGKIGQGRKSVLSKAH
ncbi:D-aspartate oxidase [Grifola frondosa]|uniref:D-aspartate oxidase n=1 Tax=Grifola frondosa TaxID=5627 RepID=A0A1C7M120_GRIFR|nr:D-aspartate oxidase [Grifola frondosa]